jgi:large subunit ribosomal protein L9
MAKSLKLLLIENVESLGIVGDVVNVRTGYARNFLLPRNLATQPSDDKVQELAGKRADAQKMLAAERQKRVELNGKLVGVSLTLTRSCNDQGILYGAVTQQDLAAALKEQGFTVSPRDVRITQTIKRVDSFDVTVKLDSDLDSTIKVHIKADRELPQHSSAPTEEQAAAGAGAAEGGRGGGAEERPSRRRDAWMLPDDTNRVIGWGKKEDKKDDAAKSESKGEGKSKSEGKSKGDGAEKKGKKKAE